MKEKISRMILHKKEWEADMNNINYQKELERIITSNQEKKIKPTLLLHACCAPCSSYVLEYLNSYFDITVYFYNPNISPIEEYEYRAEELKRLIDEMGLDDKVKCIVEKYSADEFYSMSEGLEQAPEGGARCFKCYELRLEKTAKIAADMKFDYFTTTLSISPLKNSQKLNEIGKMLSNKYDIQYLVSDFKKKNGYKRSIELSKQYNLYRQNFCGCVYSKQASEQ